MTTTVKTIAHLAASLDAVDLTHKPNDVVNSLRNLENGFSTVLDSYGANGRNAVLLKGKRTGRLYAITARTSALFLI